MAEGTAVNSAPRGAPQAGTEYSAIDAKKMIPDLLVHLQHHAIVVWVLVPLFAVAQAVVPPMQPGCEDGSPDILYFSVCLMVTHHIVAESRAWAAAKALLTPPEITVVRHLGVLRKRRRLVATGVVEGLAVYMMLVFPLAARSCHLSITEPYKQAWRKVPVFGAPAVEVISVLHFWGLATMSVCFLVATNLWSVLRMFIVVVPSHEPDASGVTVHGDDFFQLARHAEAALMPSVALLCEEMASQKRYLYDSSKDTAQLAKAHQDRAFGKINYQMLEELETQDLQERERVDQAEKRFHVFFIVMKVFFGALLQLWLQTSFLQIAFDIVGDKARFKIVLGIGTCAIAIGFRGMSIMSSLARLGFLGLAFAVICALVIVWTGMKVYMAFQCEDHVWNLSTGCVDIHHTEGA